MRHKSVIKPLWCVIHDCVNAWAFGRSIKIGRPVEVEGFSQGGHFIRVEPPLFFFPAENRLPAHAKPVPQLFVAQTFRVLMLLNVQVRFGAFSNPRNHAGNYTPRRKMCLSPSWLQIVVASVLPIW